MPSTFTIIAIVVVFLMIATIVILSFLLKKSKTELANKTTACKQTSTDLEQASTDLEQANKNTALCEQNLTECKAAGDTTSTKLQKCKNNLKKCRNNNNETEDDSTGGKESFTQPVDISMKTSSMTNFAGITLDSPNINQWLQPTNLNTTDNSWNLEYLAMSNPKNYWNRELTQYNLYDAELARNLSHRYCDESQTECNGVDLEAAMNENNGVPKPQDTSINKDTSINDELVDVIVEKQNTTTPDDLAKFEQLDV